MTTGTPTGTNNTYTIDQNENKVSEIVVKLQASRVTNRSTVAFTVNFSETVNGLASNDFSANTGGFVGTTGTINVSAASGTSVDVTINSVAGDGTLGLNVLTANVISDASANSMTTGTPTGTNDTYTIDQTAPEVSSIAITP